MSVQLSQTIFRAYDIRGVVDQDLSPDIMQTLGLAVGSYFRNVGARRLVIARDARLSSPEYSEAFINGVRRTGIHVLSIGQVPTPVMYFALEHLGTDGGAIISASHNPPQHNGVKVRRAHSVYGGEPLTSDEIQQLYHIASTQTFMLDEAQGALEEISIDDAYVKSVAALFPIQPIREQGQTRLPKIVLDSGNGVAGPLGIRAFEAAGVEVVPLFTEPDGRFPNHHPDPSKEENMRALGKAVLAEQADLGIALDGDGDRLGVVDRDGEMIWTDRYMIAMAQYVLAHEAGPIVYDVRCSGVLERAIRDFGGEPVMWKTGYSHVSAKMRAISGLLGCDLSGHVFPTRTRGHYFDDGTAAGLFLLSVLRRMGGNGLKSLADVLAPYPALPSLNESRIPYDESQKFAVVEHVRRHFSGQYPCSDVDGVRIDFGDGWGLLRASNTEAALTTRFEAQTEPRVQEIRAMIMSVVENYRPEQKATQ